MRAKLSRKSQAVNRLVKNLTSSLVLNEQITTTVAKAKATKIWFEGLRADLKKDQFNALRSLKNKLGSELASKKLLDLAKDDFPKISIYKLGKRFGDNASMAKIMIEIKKPVEKKEAKNAKQK